MIWKFLSIFNSLVFFISASTFSQNDWELKLNKEGIKVYTKKTENSAFKAVKTICTINTTLTRLTTVLLDINSHPEWVYATKKCVILKQPNPFEVIYYSEIAAPWPASNRDIIVQLKISQNEKTKVITVEGENKPAYIPDSTKMVRIQDAYLKWIITPLGNEQAQIEYVLQVDPAGNVPAWLINLFATRGPFESFKKLRNQVKKAAYNNVSLSFIKD